jgi:hypothetical protein
MVETSERYGYAARTSGVASTGVCEGRQLVAMPPSEADPKNE